MSGRRRSRRERALARQQPASPPSVPPASSAPQVVTQQFLSTSFFSGPLPPPELLAQYDQVSPGAATKIIAIAERQADHRQDLESRVVKNNITMERAGMASALLITLACLSLAGWVAYLGGEHAALAAFGIVITNITGLASLFVYGRQKQAVDLARKWQSQQQPQRRS